ncbi:MAG: 50S ribosomal protein L1 [Bacteroidetes bacterium]|nr:50S ribosomal protein L1 [Bacteroidota bacterium]
MAKISKKRKAALAKVDGNKLYTLAEAVKLVKEVSYTKFDSSVDIDVRLGVDPKKSNQMVRGTVTLPHGTGKTIRVLVLCTPDKEAEATEAGADFVGLDEYIAKIEKGWTDVDLVITMPSVMGKVGRLGKILGPRNLMPNPKSGTVTVEVGKAVKEAKAGKVEYKVDKTGIIHNSVGKSSFAPDKLMDNAAELIQNLVKSKPSSSKGTYLRTITISSTMSPGIAIDTKSIPGI